MIIPGSADIIIVQGASFNPYWIMAVDDVPVDLSTYTAIFRARHTTDNDTVLINLTTENGGITLDSVGKIQLSMTGAQTAALSFCGDAVYNLEIITAGGVPDRILQGAITLDLGTIY